MSDRHKPHNGRDLNGARGVPEADVEGDLPGEGLDAHVPEVIRHSGAVADIGPLAGEHGRHVQELVDQDRAQRASGGDQAGSGGRGPKS